MTKILVYIYTGFVILETCFCQQNNSLPKEFPLLYSMPCDHDKTLELNTSGVKIHFHDFENNRYAQYHIDNALHGIFTQHLNYTKKLVFYVPGYTSNMNGPTVALIKEEFQKASDTYLIIVDYSAYTTSVQPIPLKTYKLSVMYAYYIGKSVGLFLSGFRDKGFSSTRIHGIGHSFGGQLLGYIGGSYLNDSNEVIDKLSAIDPAGLCFASGPVEDQIRSGLAKNVEVYHCNAGVYGSTSLLADADFFFGNGRTQPQCVERDGYKGIAAETCSHMSCVKYWTKTIHNPGYWAKACHSYEAFVEGACDESNETVAGYRSTGNLTGVFYIPVKLYETI